MSGQQVGYVRVSSLLQNTARQLDGITLDEVFVDRVSARDRRRPELEACIKHLRAGDTLHVHSIDRLARNLKDLQDIVDELTSAGVTVRFHKEGLTFSGHEDPMSKLMLQMMGAFAEFERSLINERRKEGMAIAKSQGKPIGRPRKLTEERIAAIKLAAAAGTPKAKIARDFGISRQKVYDAISASS